MDDSPPLVELHPALWRAHQLGQARTAVTASGFDLLDVQLPGGGWPHGVLTELLLPHPGLGEMRLLAPALAQLAGRQRCTLLFDPPAALCGWALAQLGVDAQQLIVVHGREGARGAATLRRVGSEAPRGGLARPAPRGGSSPVAKPHGLVSADLLWALEQSLKSGHVGAVLAWLPPRLPADALRRLQLAAQSHDGPAFLFREIDARCKPSAAPLRLALQCGAVDELVVRVLKRRGPPLAQPLRLDLPPVLAPALRARSRAVQGGPAVALPGAAAGRAGARPAA